MAARKNRPIRTCDAPGCDTQVRRGILMCRSHWFQVPKPLRDAISQTWAAGQIRAWSANCIEARSFLATKAAKASTIAARITGDNA